MNNTLKLANVCVVTILVGCGGGGSSSQTSEPTINLNLLPNNSVNEDSSYQLQKTSLHINRRYGINSESCSCFNHAVVYADLDNDGDIDVFMSGGNGSRNPNPVEIYINDGAETFTLDNSLIFGDEPGAVHPRKALLGDYNGDGKLDIFVAAHGFDAPPFAGEHPLLFLSTENGLEYSSSLESHVGFFHAAASADIDNDGDIDIFLSGNEMPFFLINDGNGNFSKNTARLTTEIAGKPAFTSELIDIDQDGYVDLLLAGHEFEGMDSVIYWGSSTGTYLSSNKSVLPAVFGQGVVVDIDAEDINNDGRKDIVLTRTGGGNDNFYRGFYLQLILNQGNHQFSDASSNITANSDENAEWIDWIRVQDYNNDGFLDIINDNESSESVWFNDGNGFFAH